MSEAPINSEFLTLTAKFKTWYKQKIISKNLRNSSKNTDFSYSCTYTPKTEESTNFAFDLTKRNMQELYEAAPEWGWKDDEKNKEIESEHQHLILIKHQEKPVGFAAFRLV